MQKFTDDNGKEWKVEILIGTAKYIREKYNVDLLTDWESEDARVNLLHRLKSDIILFGDILNDCIVGADESLFAGLKADGLQRAYNAFWKDLVYFFPEASKREALALAVERADQIVTNAWSKTCESLKKNSSKTID